MANPNPTPPPEKNRFKPGQSGNPKGRTKGTKNISKALARLLEEEIEVKKKGPDGDLIKEKMSVADAIAYRQVNKAMSGDLHAAKWIADRVEGSVTNNVNLGMDEGGEITITRRIIQREDE